MKCLDVGTLRAFVDGELLEERRGEVLRHVSDCAECRRALEQVGETSSWASAKLASLEPTSTPHANTALAGLRQRMAGSHERRSLLARLGALFTRQRYGFSVAAIAVLLAFSVALVYPPVRTTAESFLAVFRVKKFEAVQVDPAKMPKLPAPTNVGEFTFVSEPRIQTNVSLEEARKSVDFSLRTPSRVPSTLAAAPSVMVSSVGEAAVTIDLEKVTAYLASIGATDVNLPPSLDGATIKAKFTPYVGLIYSDKSIAEMTDQGLQSPPSNARILFVAQGRSPVVEAPANLDLEQLRSQILQIPGLPPEFVARVSEIQDWRGTLLVPLTGETSQEIKVDGNDGLLITSKEQGMTVAVWQKNDVLYAVGGNLAASEIVEVANSLR